MDLVWLVYGISLLGSIGPLIGMTITFSLVGLTVLLMVRHIGLQIESWDGEFVRKSKAERIVGVDRWIKILSILLVVVAVVGVLIPSEKTAYMMVGAYTAQKIAENDKVQETGQKVLQIINQKLDTYVEEGIKTAEKKVKDATK